jgi:hypothetical protein
MDFVERLAAFPAHRLCSANFQGQQMENEEHYAVLEEFSADVKNIRFIENRANWAALMEFLTDHDLETTTGNLKFAYDALSKNGLLELEPIRTRACASANTNACTSAISNSSTTSYCCAHAIFQTRYRGGMEERTANQNGYSQAMVKVRVIVRWFSMRGKNINGKVPRCI